MKLTTYSDGGSRNNPGHAAIGVVISDESGAVIKKIGKYIGIKTNNQAEYEALVEGLTEALALGAKEVTCYLDSELVVKQVTGLYKVREEGLKDYVMQVLRLKNQLERVEFKHVMREKNKLADELVNQTLDNEGH